MPAAFLIFAHISLVPRPIGRTRCLPLVNIEENLTPLSMLVVGFLSIALGIQALVFRLPGFLLATLVLSLTKSSNLVLQNSYRLWLPV